MKINTMARNNMLVCLSAVLLALLVAQTWSARLPDTTNQLDAIQQLQDGSSAHDYEEEEVESNVADASVPAALSQWQLPHESYDKNDDVVEAVESSDSDVDADDDFDAGADSAGVYVYGDDDDDEDAVAEVPVRAQRKRRELSDWLIAPNTRWCGRGNTANGTYNHLGGASAADKCCRKHDHCQIFIPAMSNRYELFNYRPYTLSHCNCDRRFRTCLKMANDEDANTIGKLFFNMVQTQCFILRAEHICLKRADDGSCLEEMVKQKAYLKNNKKF